MQYFGRLILGCVLLFGALVAAPRATAQSTEQVVTITPLGESYIDPEILPGGSLMTYQSQGNIYLAKLNTKTGLFVTPEGKDVLIDSGAARPLETFNGPEFGMDANGWALYYAKADQGVVQVWRAALNGDDPLETTPLTAGARHQTQLVSRNPQAETTRIAAIRGTWQSGMAIWFDESTPDNVAEISSIEGGSSSMRWVDDSYLLTYSERTGADRGQVVLLDTTTNTRHTITSDTGDKTDPYGWYAPEYGGEMLVLANVDNAAVAVYRDTGGAYWERIMTIRPPDDSRFDFVSSAEPFTVNGRSYMSLVIKEADSNRQRFSDSEVWLFDLNPDPVMRYAERCDNGESGIARSDPEVFIGTRNVFVYCNVIGGSGVTPYEIRRCQSALTVGSGSTTAQLPPTQPATDNTSCQRVMPQDTDSQIDTELEPHYVCYDPAIEAREQLLVFFPGTGAYPEDYGSFVQEDAALGMHAVGLSYVNPFSINLQICSRDPDPDCHEDVRREVLYGENLRPDIDVNASNAAVNRLVQLLHYMDNVQPDSGWDQYFDGETPRWDRIVVAGHSQGAGMAAYLTHDHPVARAVLFSWVDVRRGEAVPWILETHATPAERIYFFDHIEDRARGEAAKLAMFHAFGIDAWGEANVDRQPAPYGNAHVLQTAITPAEAGEGAAGSHIANPAIAGPHNVVVVDDFTPQENGVPVLRDVWHYLLDSR